MLCSPTLSQEAGRAPGMQLLYPSSVSGDSRREFAWCNTVTCLCICRYEYQPEELGSMLEIIACIKGVATLLQHAESWLSAYLHQAMYAQMQHVVQLLLAQTGTGSQDKVLRLFCCTLHSLHLPTNGCPHGLWLTLALCARINLASSRNINASALQASKHARHLLCMLCCSLLKAATILSMPSSMNKCPAFTVHVVLMSSDASALGGSCTCMYTSAIEVAQCSPWPLKHLAPCCIT